MKRIIRFLFEMMGLLLILMIIGMGAFALRLEQGPISLNAYLEDAEAFFRQLAPGYDFRIANVQMEIDPRYQSLRIRMQAVQVINDQGDDIGTIKDMILGYNWRNIAGLTVMPISAEIERPTVDLTRFENGYLGFNLKEDQDDKDAVPDQDDVSVEDVLAFLGRAPQALRFIRISDAAISYHNLQRDYVLKAKNGLFDFQRIRGDIRGTMTLDVVADSFNHRVQGSISYNDENDYTDVNLGVTQVLLDDLRVLTPDIPKDLSFDVPMNLLVTAAIDRTLQWTRADILLTGKEGNLLFPPYFNGTIRISDIAVNGIYEPVKKHFTLKNFVTKIGQSSLTAKGAIDFSQDDMRVSASAQVHDVPVDRLRLYWPQGLGTNARDWITQYIQHGKADFATVDVALIVPQDKSKEPDITHLDGRITFSNITVDYLTPMPIVKGVNGVAVFDTENFDIAASDGKLFDSVVKHGDVRISKLLTDDPEIAIQLDIEGPIRDAIETISSEPLQYAQRMGMTPQQFSGTSLISLNLAFPLLNDLMLDQVNMQAVATLQDATIKNVLKDLTVTADSLELTVNTEEMLVTGNAKINQAQAEIQWQEYFTDVAEYTTVIRAKGDMSPAVLRGLRLPIDHYFSGKALSDVVMHQDQDKNIHVAVTADLQGMAVSVPEYGLAKSAQAMGKADFKVDIQENGVTTISDAHISWPNVMLQNGMLRINEQQEVESLTLKNLRAGRTRADLIMSPDGRGGTRLVINGDVVDGHAYWTYKAPLKKETSRTSSNQAMDISIRAGTLYLDNEYAIDRARVDALLHGNDLVRARIHGNVGDKKSAFSVIQEEQKDGTRVLDVRVADTGALLRALDSLDEMHGGVLEIRGQSLPDKPKEVMGDALLTQFTLVKAPVLARLLTAFSPVGLINLLNNDGLSFEKMQSRFVMHDIKMISLDKGKMAGNSLGLSFSGTVDRYQDQLNIKGTIVPLDGINKFFGRIPLLGQILTGLNGDGLIGATYTVKGSANDPKISVNPLSALTPGIFRSILFE